MFACSLLLTDKVSSGFSQIRYQVFCQPHCCAFNSILILSRRSFPFHFISMLGKVSPLKCLSVCQPSVKSWGAEPIKQTWQYLTHRHKCTYPCGISSVPIELNRCGVFLSIVLKHLHTLQWKDPICLLFTAKHYWNLGSKMNMKLLAMLSLGTHFRDMDWKSHNQRFPAAWKSGTLLALFSAAVLPFQLDWAHGFHL